MHRSIPRLAPIIASTAAMSITLEQRSVHSRPEVRGRLVTDSRGLEARPSLGARTHGAHQDCSAGERLDAAALYRLTAWLSPAYPVGAFSYSSGIEWAVEARDIKDAETLRGWLAVMIGEGGGFCDAVFFAHAHRAAAADDDAALRVVAELAAAFAPSKERHLESTAQGNAFVEATRAAWGCDAIERLRNIWDGP